MGPAWRNCASWVTWGSEWDLTTASENDLAVIAALVSWHKELAVDAGIQEGWWSLTIRIRANSGDWRGRRGRLPTPTLGSSTVYRSSTWPPGGFGFRAWDWIRLDRVSPALPPADVYPEANARTHPVVWKGLRTSGRVLAELVCAGHPSMFPEYLHLIRADRQLDDPRRIRSTPGLLRSIPACLAPQKAFWTFRQGGCPGNWSPDPFR